MPDFLEPPCLSYGPSSKTGLATKGGRPPADLQGEQDLPEKEILQNVALVMLWLPGGLRPVNAFLTLWGRQAAFERSETSETSATLSRRRLAGSPNNQQAKGKKAAGTFTARREEVNRVPAAVCW